MKLLKLTPAKDKALPAYVSADVIIGMERNEELRDTIVYTSLRGWYLRVIETPEEIERLANSSTNPVVTDELRMWLENFDWDGQTYEDLAALLTDTFDMREKL